jgi:hypothetical protein
MKDEGGVEVASGPEPFCQVPTFLVLRIIVSFGLLNQIGSAWL